MRVQQVFAATADNDLHGRPANYGSKNTFNIVRGFFHLYYFVVGFGRAGERVVGWFLFCFVPHGCVSCRPCRNNLSAEREKPNKTYK